MSFFDEVGLKFKKTGAEVKNAISNRLEDLQKRAPFKVCSLQ